MNSIKTLFIGKITAVLLAAAILLPVSVKFAHSLENHSHQVCTSKHAKHIHQIDHDCEFHKFKLNNPLSFVVQSYQLIELTPVKQDFTAYYEFLSDYQLLHFNRRGPPQLI